MAPHVGITGSEIPDRWTQATGLSGLKRPAFAVFASDCSYIDKNTTDKLYFVYCYLKENMYQLDAMQRGSAQPHVYAKDINAMRVGIPRYDLIALFCNKVSDYYDLIGRLQLQSSLASEARDRLLPKLMSGEIEV